MTLESPLSSPSCDREVAVLIRVAGELGEEWSDRVGGMTVSVCRRCPGDTFTDLYGELPDDAALMGVLEALYSHGARLLRVERSIDPGRRGRFFLRGRTQHDQLVMSGETSCGKAGSRPGANDSP